MADDKVVGEGEKKETKTSSTAAGNEKKKSRGFISRIWNGIFRLHGDDFEKRLQYISKEEATVIARMTRRSRSRRHVSRNLIVFSVIFEVCYVFLIWLMVDYITLYAFLPFFVTLPIQFFVLSPLETFGCSF
jgi:hypothetical protein